jgi:putative hydrolase of the HAD superfamily
LARRWRREAASRRVDAILFDADGVIQRAPADIRLRIAAALGAAEGDAEACMADVFAAEAPALIGQAEFAAALVPVLTRWCAACEPAHIQAVWHTFDVDLGVLDLVRELRRAGLVCAIASNQEASRAQCMSERDGYRAAFDREHYSCHLGHAKPGAAFFTELIRQGGYEPARTLFIDDREDNVAAARAAGLLAERFVLERVGEGAAPMRALLGRYGLG